MKQIYIACDHAGLDLKDKIVSQFKSLYQIKDLGVFSGESVDYPDYADKVCRQISKIDGASEPVDFGILVCGSGQGMAIRANKYLHIRAALCWSEESAKLSREHNNANVLCLGARLSDHELCLNISKLFLTTQFLGGRHALRVLKIQGSC